MSRRALGANTLLSFRQINQSSLNFDGLCVCKQRKGYLQKSLFKQLAKFQVKKKGLIGLQDSYQDWLVLFNVSYVWWISCGRCAHCVVVHVKTVKIKVSGVLIKTKPNLKIIDKQFPETIPGNFISTSIVCIIFARLACCCCLPQKFWKDLTVTTLL